MGSLTDSPFSILLYSAILLILLILHILFIQLFISRIPSIYGVFRFVIETETVIHIDNQQLLSICMRIDWTILR